MAGFFDGDYALYTSCFGRMKRIPLTHEPIAISAARPRFFKGRVMSCLAPTYSMIKLPEKEYGPLFAKILSRLDPERVMEEIGGKAVLLCWEKPGDYCHRRLVAKWLENALGIVVPELGFEP